MEGFLNTSGIQTQAKGEDSVPDAIHKTYTKIRVTGRAIPSHTIMHPTDWEGIRLLTTVDGIYIWGPPSDVAPERIWGVPIVQSDAISVGTSLSGGFTDWCMYFERRGIVVEIGFVDDQFIKGTQTIRASQRGAMVVWRPAAFATTTGL